VVRPVRPVLPDRSGQQGQQGRKGSRGQQGRKGRPGRPGPQGLQGTPGAVATGIYEGKGAPTSPAPQGTLYYDNTGTLPNFSGGGGFLYEYTGTGTSTTVTLIGNGVVDAGFTPTAAGANIFTNDLAVNVPPSLTAAPFHVFFAYGSFDSLFVADANGVYHFVGILYPGAQ
jgi:hypothetical protein